MNDTGAVDCLDSGVDGLCNLRISFTAEGFPPDAEYRVAIRLLDPVNLEPDDFWQISEPPVPDGSTGMPMYDASGYALSGAEAAEGSILVQVAVLIFQGPLGPIPDETPLLGEAGADYAFVTTEIAIETTAFP